MPIETDGPSGISFVATVVEVAVVVVVDGNVVEGMPLVELGTASLASCCFLIAFSNMIRLSVPCPGFMPPDKPSSHGAALLKRLCMFSRPALLRSSPDSVLNFSPSCPGRLNVSVVVLVVLVVVVLVVVLVVVDVVVVVNAVVVVDVVVDLVVNVGHS